MNINELVGGNLPVDGTDISSESFIGADLVVIAVPSGPGEGTPMAPADPNDFDFANYTAIGVVQEASIAQNKQLAQIFEIGSRTTFLKDGRTQTQASIARVHLSGGSLLKVLYGQHGEDDEMAAGSSDFYLNLAAKYFKQLIDIAFFFFREDGGEMGVYGGFLLRGAKVQAHQFRVGSQDVILMENVAIRVSDIESLVT